MSIFLGRQPILDGDRRRHGYELLYRSGNVDAAFFGNPQDATQTVVGRALLEWGLPDLVGDGLAFINVTAEFLQSGMYTVLPVDQVVFELRASDPFDWATIESVREASRHGYRFALDDLVPTSVHGIGEILPYVDVAKVEVLSLEPAVLERFVAELRGIAPHALFIAERVETIEAFERCRKLGFELFQGYFFAKAEVVSRGSRPISQQSAIGLMAAVQDPTITIDDLVDLASADPTLTYRLLKLVNASAMGLAHHISSVRQAVVLLGLDHVRQLATLLTLSDHTDNNRELITLAVTRAHMARQLLSDRGLASSAFTAGLLSVIDVVFQTPMSELLADLPVTVEVRNALLHGTGPIGEALQLIHAHEQADVAEMQRLGDLDLDSIRAAYAHSTTKALHLDRQPEPVGR